MGVKNQCPRLSLSSTAYRKLSDGQYETISASEKLRPELTEREIKKFVVQNDAANDVSQSASDELACLSVRIVFPALRDLQWEDAIKQKIFATLDGDDGIHHRGFGTTEIQG